MHQYCATRNKEGFWRSQYMKILWTKKRKTVKPFLMKDCFNYTVLRPYIRTLKFQRYLMTFLLLSSIILILELFTSFELNICKSNKRQLQISFCNFAWYITQHKEHKYNKDFLRYPA